MSAREKFLAEVEAFMSRHDMPPSTFGRLAMSDATFVFDLRKGQDIKMSTADRCRQFMNEYRAQRTRRVEKNGAAA